MTIRRIRRGLIALGVLCLGALAVRPLGVDASDHNEPQSINAIAPGTLSDAGDIYGNFAFPTEDSIVFILTFPAPPYGWGYLPGPDEPQVWDESAPNAYDDGVLYAFHMDVDVGLFGDRNLVDDEITITARFGYDAEHRTWGIQIDGIPGENRPLVGPVGSELRGNSGVRAQAGLFDEPFFVDLERFFDGLQPANPDDLSSAVLDFREEVDFFAGYNVHGIVIEVPKENIATRFRRHLSVWNTSHRLPSDPNIRPGNVCSGEAP